MPLPALRLPSLHPPSRDRVRRYLEACRGSVLGRGPKLSDMAQWFGTPWQLVRPVLLEMEADGEVKRGAAEGWELVEEVRS